MDLQQENLPLVAVTHAELIRGRVRPRPRPDDIEMGLSEPPPPSDPGLIALYNVTILDHSRRVIRRVPELILNVRHVVYFMEDDLAPQMDKIKALLAAEDHEAALLELDHMLGSNAADGELLYLAGIVFHHAGHEERAFDNFNRALALTLDEKVRAVIKRHIESRD